MTLEIEVLEVFAEAQERLRATGYEDCDGLAIHYVDTAWACGKTSRRRLEIRAECAAARSPCPHCGAPVERDGSWAKIPKYCSVKCMRAAQFANWYAKHGAEYNRSRRKTDRKSPSPSPTAP